MKELVGSDANITFENPNSIVHKIEMGYRSNKLSQHFKSFRPVNGSENHGFIFPFGDFAAVTGCIQTLDDWAKEMGFTAKNDPVSEGLVMVENYGAESLTFDVAFGNMKGIELINESLKSKLAMMSIMQDIVIYFRGKFPNNIEQGDRTFVYARFNLSDFNKLGQNVLNSLNEEDRNIVENGTSYTGLRWRSGFKY